MPSIVIGSFLTVTIIADLIETEFVLLIREHRFVGIPESDDALNGQVLGKTQELGDILC